MIATAIRKQSPEGVMACCTGIGHGQYHPLRQDRNVDQEHYGVFQVLDWGHFLWSRGNRERESKLAQVRPVP